jgi:signal transduction histidine kinase
VQFLEGVRAAVRRAASRRDPWPPLERLVDAAELRGELRRVIDSLPASEEGAAKRWAGDTLERFLEWLLPQLLSLELGQSADDLQRLVRACLRAFVMGTSVVGFSVSTTAEIDLIKSGLKLDALPVEITDAWHVPVLYAEHLGLIRSGVWMPAGQMLLSLGDQGARRWLLTLEVHQSLGNDDPWRLPRSHLESLLRRPKGKLTAAANDPFLPHDRLIELGLVDFVMKSEDVGRATYSLSDSNAAELRAVLAEQSPMWGLAKAITPDPSTSLPIPNVDAAQRIGARQAGRAAAELGRTAAHELMNILPLMESSITQLGTLLSGTSEELVAASEIRKLAGNLERLYRYRDWFRQLGEGLDRPPERFGALAMLEDAIQLANGGALERELAILPELSLYGLRDRLVIALVNLLRNARQHGARRVRIAARTHEQQLFLEVDDDGPGVPPDKIDMIFVSPFSTRADGSGEGLPLAKRILEDEHQGSIGYSRSPLGGARFTIRLPV